MMLTGAGYHDYSTDTVVAWETFILNEIRLVCVIICQSKLRTLFRYFSFKINKNIILTYMIYINAYWKNIIIVFIY